MRQNRLDLGQILTTQSLSDSCGPLRASPGALAKSPAIPVIRIRLAFEPEPLDAKRRDGRNVSRVRPFERPGRRKEAAAR